MRRWEQTGKHGKAAKELDFFFNIVLGETPIEAFKQENHVVPVLGRVALPGD